MRGKFRIGLQDSKPTTSRLTLSVGPVRLGYVAVGRLSGFPACEFQCLEKERTMKRQSAPTLSQPQILPLFWNQRLLLLTLGIALACAVPVQAQLRLKTAGTVYFESNNEGLTEADLDRRIRDYNIAI